MNLHRVLAVCAVLLVVSLGRPLAASSTPIFTTVLRGANEVPPNGSSAIGVAIVDLSGNVLTVNEIFVGLVGGPATAAHIHCCGPVGVTEPVAVPFPGFPAATFGTYSQTFDLTSLATYTAPFVAANGGTALSAEAALIAGLNAGLTYANIHDAVFPGGEIRGQLEPVPEPATLLLWGTTMAAVSSVVRWRRRGIRRERHD